MWGPRQPRAPAGPAGSLVSTSFCFVFSAPVVSFHVLRPRATPQGAGSRAGGGEAPGKAIWAPSASSPCPRWRTSGLHGGENPRRRRGPSSRAPNARSVGTTAPSPRCLRASRGRKGARSPSRAACPAPLPPGRRRPAQTPPEAQRGLEGKDAQPRPGSPRSPPTLAAAGPGGRGGHAAEGLPSRSTARPAEREAGRPGSFPPAPVSGLKGAPSPSF